MEAITIYRSREGGRGEKTHKDRHKGWITSDNE